MSGPHHNSQTDKRFLRLIASVLRLTLPSRVRENVVGDLLEEYREDILPRRGRWKSQLWAIGQALSWSLRYRLRRAPSAGPSHQMGSGWNVAIAEIRQAVRTLSRAPLFTLAAVSMLGVGIGATATIFTVVNNVLLRPLRYPNAARLAMLWERNLGPEARGPQSPVSPANFTDWKKQSGAFQYMAAVRNAPLVLSGENTARRVKASRVSTDLFPLLGVSPLIGRSFLDEDDQPGGHPTVILSYGLWHRRFSADPTIAGKSIRLNDTLYSVVGVMPSEFEFPPSITVKGISGMEPAELWVPLRLGTTGLSRDSSTLRVFGLMAPGIVPLKAQAEMDAIAARLKTQYPATNRNSEITVVPLQKQVVANVAASLWLLFAATGLVLVVTCVNVGNLFLARAVARRREVAIRSALGAGRSRLAGQLLTECVLLSGLSGMAALALTGASLKVLPFWLPLNFPRIDEIGLDVQVVILIAVVSLTSGLLLGLFPALSASRCEATEGLGDGGRANVSGRRESSLSRVLVASQFAAAALLLICSGLLMKSFVHLQQVEPGFKASNLLAMRVNLPLAKYTSTVRVAALYEELIRRVQNLPGVQAATVSLFLPFGNSQLGVNLDLEGGQLRTDEHKPVASYHVIGPDHFETMGIRILEGRSFQWNDNPAAARVAIVSASMAKLFWPNRNPVGKRLRLGDPDDDPTWMTIVGVAGDIRQYGLDVDPRPTLYVPALQHSETSLYLVARTKIDPERLAGIVTNEIASLDRGIAVSDVGTVLGKIQQSVQQRQLVMLLVSGFGVVALLLAAFGIYAVLTYFVSRKTQEIGIRMAVGATRANVLCQILGFGCPPAFAGIGAGLAMALMAGRILAGFLYETRFYDAPVILGASLSLLAVGLVATYIPARRAMNVDPMTALRSDR